MSFASRLRERREALGLKQNELGHLLGITGSAIGNYENGVSSPKADILYKVFDVLKCDANFLFQDEMRELETDDFTVPEIRMVKKYRSLDQYSQKAVDDLLETEYLRGMEAQRTKKDDTAATTIEKEARDEAERYYQELVREKRQTSQALFANESDAG